MDTFECIKTRYSCRDYIATPVARDLLEKLVDAGRRAPTARKVEPVDFIVVTDPTRRAYIAGLTNAGKFIAQAPACIVVISKDTNYFLEDGCAAVENILLAATALDLQSCWVAGDKKPYASAVLEFLQVPAGHKLIALLAIGYTNNPGQQPPRRPLADVLHWETF